MVVYAESQDNVYVCWHGMGRHTQTLVIVLFLKLAHVPHPVHHSQLVSERQRRPPVRPVTDQHQLRRHLPRDPLEHAHHVEQSLHRAEVRDMKQQLLVGGHIVRTVGPAGRLAESCTNLNENS